MNKNMIDTFEVDGVRVVNIHNESEIATFAIAVRAGADFETPEVAGIAHFAEHMFFSIKQSLEEERKIPSSLLFLHVLFMIMQSLELLRWIPSPMFK